MRLVHAGLLSLALTVSGTAVATPMEVAQQGRIFGPQGPLDGPHDVVFAIYTTPDGIDPVWTEEASLEFTAGFYATQLGDTPDNPLDDVVFSGDVMYLDISIDGSAPLAPRQAIGSVPYAIRAEVATRLEGGKVDASSVDVNGAQVIDDQGNWVGPTPTIDFADVGSLPSNLQSLVNLGPSCMNGDVVTWDEPSAAWSCGPDHVLDEAQVDNYVSNNGFALDSELSAVARTGEYGALKHPPSLAAVATSGSYGDLSGTPALAPVATSGAYGDLTGTPDLAPVATSGKYGDLDATPALATVATSGKYSDLSGKPPLAPVATSGNYSDLTGAPALATVATSGQYGDLSGTPALASVATSGSYGDLTGTPALAAVATSGQYGDLSGTPALASVATSGSYGDLSDTPALAPVATSGNYSDLSGTPALASVATSGNYGDLGGTPALAPVATSGQYSDLNGAPALAPVATSGKYSDLSGKPALASVATSGDYRDLSNTPTLSGSPPIKVSGTSIGLDVPTCGTGQVITWNGSAFKCQAAVPSGAILFFPGTCPSGWTEYTALRGRVPLGLPSGGTAKLTRGSALGNNGARVITQVPAHTHVINPPATTTSAAGNHHHGISTLQDDYNVSGGTGPSWGADNGPYRVYHYTEYAGNHTHSVDIPPFTSGSTGPASVEVSMPYIQLRACQAP